MKGNKNIYQVPEGYFDSLKTRLQAIPVEDKRAVHTVTLWQRVQPFAALAACFAMVLAVGTLFLGTPASRDTGADLQNYYYTHLHSVEDPMALFSDEYESTIESASDDDILEYLISSGATAAYVSYMINQ